jgi:hypothetical protein
MEEIVDLYGLMVAALLDRETYLTAELAAMDESQPAPDEARPQPAARSNERRRLQDELAHTSKVLNLAGL